jgi:predicted MFS family arabinose efflux permease
MRHPDVRFPLVAMAFVGTFALNSTVTTPLLARITFHAGAALFAAFGSVAGFGALLGTLTMASRREARVSLIGGAALAFGALTLLVAVSPHPIVALPLFACASFAGSLYISATNARLQAVADDHYRGRVMSLYSVLFLGSTPIGSVIVSVVADLTNPRVALAIGGVAATATGVVALARLRGARRRGATEHLLPAGGEQFPILPPDRGATPDETLARGG